LPLVLVAPEPFGVVLLVRLYTCLPFLDHKLVDVLVIQWLAVWLRPISFVMFHRVRTEQLLPAVALSPFQLFYCRTI
jgi:hypothetical protein